MVKRQCIQTLLPWLFWTHNDCALPSTGCLFISILTTLTYKVLTFNQLLYLTHLLAPYTVGSSLRLQDKHLQFPPLQAVKTSVMHSMCNKLLLKFTTACCLLLLRATLRHYFLRVFSSSCLAIFPPSNCPQLRFSPPVDHVHVINVNCIVLYVGISL